MKVGIPSDFYTTRYDLQTSVKLIKEHGYDCVDFEDFADTTTEFFRLPEEEFIAEVKRIRKVYEDAGLWINQTHAPWCWPPPDETEQKRKIRTEEMKKAVRGTGAIGAECFVVHPLMPFGPDSGENPEQMKEINLKFLRELCREGRNCGVTICLENMPFKNLPVSSVDQIIEFVKLVNEPNLKICLDTGHAMLWDDQAGEAVEKIGNLLACVHVHDNDGTRDAHRPIYTGKVNWQAFVDSLVKTAYNGVFSLEVSCKCPDMQEGGDIEKKICQDAKDLLKKAGL